MQADKLRALLAKATPGPWSAVNDAQHHRSVIRSGLTPVAEMWMVGQPEAERQATAALIAAMHEALPDLLAIAEAPEGLRADAMRWRALRSTGMKASAIDRLLYETVNDDCNPPYRAMKHGAELDAAIDAAMAGAVTAGGDR